MSTWARKRWWPNSWRSCPGVVDDLLRAADEDRPVGHGAGLELVACDLGVVVGLRRVVPEIAGIVGVERVARFLQIPRHEAVRRDGDLQAIRAEAGLGPDAFVVGDLRRELFGRLADIGERQQQLPRQTARSALSGLPPTPSQTGSSACSGRGDMAASVRGRAKPALPCHPLQFIELQEKVELFGEERVVVGEVVAEEREGFDEGAAPGDQLGATAGDEVDGREILEDADRIEGSRRSSRRWSAGCGW